MATRFETLNLQNPDLFGVQLTGQVGRADKANLQELADKCLDNGKVFLIFDLSALATIGGAGAKILADFQRRLVEAEGEVVIVGAGDVLRHFLEPKFEGLPLRYFDTVDEAQRCFDSAQGFSDSADQKPSPAATAAGPAPQQEPAPDAESEQEIGAVGIMDDEEGVEETVLEEIDSSETMMGRRKDHKYTSLPEAVAALGSLDDPAKRLDFAQALGNLLFSHGLAENVVLLAPLEGQLVDPKGDWRIPLECPLVDQLAAAARPMTMLDIPEDGLGEQEIELLEAVNPDMILPVSRRGTLSAIVMLNREGDEHDYSVAENFALELLIQLLGDEESAAGRAPAEGQAAELPTTGGTPAGPGADAEAGAHALEEILADVLLHLALELPDAPDRQHFWLNFARLAKAALPVQDLAFLAPDWDRPMAVVGNKDGLRSLDLGGERLQVFLRTIERPVEVGNLPSFFKEIKQKLVQSGVGWIVSLSWEQEYQGAVLIGLDEDCAMEDPTDLMVELFFETSRLLSRFEGSHDNADSNLEMVRILVSQREKRCYGSDEMTRLIVDNVRRLAKEMGFPPDQKRDLIYGCLLRDIGLIDRDDTLSTTPTGLEPEQWHDYRGHPARGADLLAGIGLSSTIIDVVLCHHERFNGEGFPQGLQGRDIPLPARVVTIVENYVGMITGLNGLAPKEPAEAAQVLRDNFGQRYDPDIVAIFLDAVLPEASRDKAQVPSLQPA